MGSFLGKCFGMRGLSLGMSVKFPSVSETRFRQACAVSARESGNSVFSGRSTLDGSCFFFKICRGNIVLMQF